MLGEAVFVQAVERIWALIKSQAREALREGVARARRRPWAGASG
jgi:hypothetical protein